MKKSAIIIIFGVIILFLGSRSLVPYAEKYWVGFLDYTNQSKQWEQKLESDWKNKPNLYLIQKLGHPSMHYSAVAASMLGKRENRDGKNELLRIIATDNNARKKQMAFRTLILWNVDRLNEMSMDFVKQGEKHVLFDQAISYLAKKKYDPVYPYIKELWDSQRWYYNGSLSLLEEFSGPRSIQLLRERLSTNISSRERRAIERTIERIQ